MSDDPRPRFYLTTAIAYAQQPPRRAHALRGDRRRRDRALAPDARRRHPVPDRHRRALGEHRDAGGRGGRSTARRSSTRRSRCSRRPRTRSGSRPTGSSGRPIPTTSAPPRRSSAARTRTATSTSGTYEGWYCPSEGFRSASDVIETARGTICPNHPDVPLQWLTERNWFFRLSAYQERLERHYAEHPTFVQPDYRRNEMLGFIRQGLEDFSISRAGAGWGIPFPIAENGETAAARGRLVGPRGRHDLRLVRRADQLRHRRRLSRRP